MMRHDYCILSCLMLEELPQYSLLNPAKGKILFLNTPNHPISTHPKPLSADSKKSARKQESDNGTQLFQAS